MNILQNKENKLLKRREVKIIVENQSNPGFASASQKVAEHFKVAEDAVAVRAIKSKFGRHTFLIDAHIYHSAADKIATEPKPKAKKQVAA